MSGQTRPKLVPQGDATTSFVLKIAALCNINCTYCYMYNKGDTSFRGKPKVMRADVAQATLDAIVTYARAHELRAVTLVLHGGEPLLVGIPWMSDFLRRVEATFVDVRAVVSLQTNATLVTPEWVSLLLASDVRVGVSLDGPPEVHDRHRVSHAGLGTYEQTRQGLDLLLDAAEQDGLRLGALCVADAGVDGRAVFEHFVELGLRRLDFLWPDYNHDVPPPWDPGNLAQYYLDVFDAWYGGRHRDVTVRWFNSAMHLMLGGLSRCENIGGGPVASVVVETDGSLQPLDTLRVSYDGFTHTGLCVSEDTIDDLRETPVFVACLAADAALPEVCRTCELLDICGGGYLPHRFGRGRQFHNESVHCLDLKIVLRHVRAVIRQDLQPLLPLERSPPPCDVQQGRVRPDPAGRGRRSPPPDSKRWVLARMSAQPEPYDHGWLEVGDGHEVYWERCGTPGAKPVVILHGGPGSGCTPGMRRALDRARHDVVLFDQRGAGRSRPHAGGAVADLSENTTHHLIADIERLRQHLGIERWLVVGFSWGTTLGLAYAETHPERVTGSILVSVTTTTRREVDWITRGVGRLFPDAWARFRAGVSEQDRDGDLCAAYSRLLHDPDAAVRERAAQRWCDWEDAHVRTDPGQSRNARYEDATFRLGFARLVTHYWRHAAWIEDGALLEGVTRLGGIPAVLIHGRRDVSSPLDVPRALSAAWPDFELVVVDEGHSGGSRMSEAIVAAAARFADST